MELTNVLALWHRLGLGGGGVQPWQANRQDNAHIFCCRAHL
ncbi:hypothetical protein EDD27_3972 [Nonomuraea polychroma]|uniref:Uncharacterized protein n=1 Tax=Nonomuraea polychroma TaxID=46176 RepID=A0A438M6V9_9ACTN|nr:hypothetical protein [Nonomuraea polychroma]RVX41440.1 hypothetical protein EDD27_3972 [Nonomuraea polychroma]